MGWLDRVLPGHRDSGPVLADQEMLARPVAPDPHNLPAFLEPHLEEFMASYLADLDGPQLRASELLFRVLPRGEILRFLIHRVVVVRHEDGGYYQIALRRSSNVTYHDADGCARLIYCCMPRGASEMQQEDVVAAQYLALQHDRESFLKAANRTLAP